MRGRKPKPTELKRLAGNPGKRALPKNEPRPADTMPKCPSHLAKAAKKKWRELAPELHRLGLLTIVDQMALAAYCQAWASWIEAEKHLEDEGRVIDTDYGQQQNPWVHVSAKAVKQMQSFGAEFGLSPSTRSRVNTKPESKHEDPFERYVLAQLGEADNSSPAPEEQED
jgi:P27 family predicted phage terminase small subunit